MKTLTHPESGKLYFVKTLSLKGQNWDSALKKAGQQGNGWRLPSIGELEEIYKQLHKNKPGLFENVIYWSLTEFNDSVAWYFDFKKGMDGTAKKILAADVIVIQEVS